MFTACRRRNGEEGADGRVRRTVDPRGAELRAAGRARRGLRRFPPTTASTSEPVSRPPLVSLRRGGPERQKAAGAPVGPREIRAALSGRSSQSSGDPPAFRSQLSSGDLGCRGSGMSQHVCVVFRPRSYFCFAKGDIVCREEPAGGLDSCFSVLLAAGEPGVGGRGGVQFM